MEKSVDLGDYYRIPADTRDLNYDQFFDQGKKSIADVLEYHSHNTIRLDESKLTKMLLNLKEIENDIG